MDIFFNVSPRMGGKTQELVADFAKSPATTLVIAHSPQAVAQIKSRLTDAGITFDKVNILSQEESMFGRSTKIDTILMDEYLMFDINNRTRLYGDYHHMTINTVRVYTTAKQLYSFSMMRQVVNYKQDNNLSDQTLLSPTNDEIWAYLLKNHFPFTADGVKRCSAIQEFREIYYNHISDLNTLRRSHVVYWPKEDWNVALAERLIRYPDMTPCDKYGVVVLG